MTDTQILTYKFRVKDASTGKYLDRYAYAVNQVWNFCAATQKQAQMRWKQGAKSRWPTHFDLMKLTTGVAAELGILSDTISMTCKQFAQSRNKIKRAPRFRASFGSKRALGWVPMINRCFRLNGDAITYKGRIFRFWKSRDIEGTIKTGAFVQDARGRWYVTFCCEVDNNKPTGTSTVGIDLGLKEFATMSTGESAPAFRHYRKYEAALAREQRARNKNRVKAIHAKIANSRKHQLHELSARLVRENKTIVVGNVNASQLAKTRMAKSVLDAGWSAFRHMLDYKARRHQAVFIEADERYTTQTCSACGTLPESRPRGVTGLRIRHWVCSDCGALHNRDHNAAKNILRVGLERQPLAEEITCPLGR